MTEKKDNNSLADKITDQDIAKRLHKYISRIEAQLNLVTEELQQLERSFTRVSTHPSMNSYDQRSQLRVIMDRERQVSEQARHYNNVLNMLRHIAGDSKE